MNELNWPNTAVKISDDNELCEVKRISMISLLCSDSRFDVLEKFSNLRTLIRVIAWCRRFVNKCNKSIKVNAPSLTADEVTDAFDVVLKLIQWGDFRQEIECLTKYGTINKGSKILGLDPFLDRHGLLRVGGRLRNSRYTFDKRHPIILPKSHFVTRLIIKAEHLKYMHLGAQGLLASLREKYWPVSGLATVKGVLRNCHVCFKFNPGREFSLKMADLPYERIKDSRPFKFVNVDFAGPFVIKESKFRNKRLIKSYVAVFVCSSSKAVHLELVSDLTSEMFLNCFKRFVGRRGVSASIYSDNATNFVAANKDFQSFFNQSKDWSEDVFNGEQCKVAIHTCTYSSLRWIT
nr:uncharacterized protein LOC111419753 [Onthophagus taurus]